MDRVDFNPREWVVVTTASGKYLGKICGDHDWTISDLRDQLLDAAMSGSFVKLCPAFDFIAPVRPVQTERGVEMRRDPVILPMDFVLGEVPVYVRPTAIYLLGEMQEEDQKTYKDFVLHTLDLAFRSRAGRANIELAGAMPSIREVPGNGRT